MSTIKGDEVDIRLECGHTATFHKRSSQFDYPDDETWCTKCQKHVHLTAAVRQKLNAENAENWQKLHGTNGPAPAPTIETHYVRTARNGEKTWVPRPTITIDVYPSGKVEICWAHNGVLTQTYNTAKRVAGFIKRHKAIVTATVWMQEDSK